MTRRQFLLTGTGAGMGVITALLSIPAIGFLLSPLFTKQRESWVAVGPLDDIPFGRPTARIVQMPIGEGFPVPPQRRVVYLVRRPDGSVLTLSNICSHMQCDVHWDENLDQFLCPCHGGLYDKDGRNVGGPPPSPLPRWEQRIRSDAYGRQILEVANRLQDPV
ncbi:MAG: ubiquinol-cytochrome c reductase iron-sulfur subunit [Candidatus Dormibacteria bacterium]